MIVKNIQENWRLWVISRPEMQIFFTDSCCCFRILGARSVTQRSLLHIEKRQVLGAILNNLVARASWKSFSLHLATVCDKITKNPKFVQPIFGPNFEPGHFGYLEVMWYTWIGLLGKRHSTNVRYDSRSLVANPEANKHTYVAVSLWGKRALKCVNEHIEYGTRALHE